MPKVRFDGKYICVGREKLALVSGEYHFWRNDRKWWRQTLENIRDGGFRLVATYVCWDYMETAPGKYDFSGATNQQRDLVGFLELCQELGLFVILRPGPYIFSEYPHLGVPAHAARYHRLHPTFLKKSEHYLNAVTAAVRPLLASNGGPVVLVQADNEIDLIMEHFDATNTFMLGEPHFINQAIQWGKSHEPGTFRSWLKATYQDIKRLNEHWGTSYRSFDAAEFFVKWPATAAERRRVIDANRYYDNYSTEYLKAITSILKRAGVDVPIYANTYGDAQPMDIPAMQEVVDLVGTDHYAPNLMPGDSPKHTSYGIRRSGAQAPLRYVAEFMSGIIPSWSRDWGFGMIDPQHHRYMGLVALLSGAQAWNWYMLVDREEWAFAPMNYRGEIREHYWKHFKDLVRVCHELDWPSYEQVSNCSLFWSRTLHYLNKTQPWKPVVAGTLPMESGEACIRASRFDQAIHALFDEDIDFDVYDPAGAFSRTKAGKTILYAGFDYIEREVENKLLSLVQKGSNLVLLGSFPVETLEGKPSQLSKLLPPMKTALLWGGNVALLHRKERQTVATQTLYLYDPAKLGPAESIEGGGGVCGCVRKHGRGRIVLLGLDPSPRALRYVEGLTNFHEACRSGVRGVYTSVWRKGTEGVIIAVNTTGQPQDLSLQIEPALLGFPARAGIRVVEMLDGAVQTVSATNLDKLRLSLAANDGAVLHLVPK